MVQTNNSNQVIQNEYSSELTDEQVGEFLTSHPDYFVHHVELLEILEIPHLSGQAVSLVERQIAVLREKNDDLQKKLDSLVDIARENDGVNQRLHDLVIQVIASVDLIEAFSILTQQLKNELLVDHVVIRLLTSVASPKSEVGPEYLLTDESDTKLFSNFIKTRQLVCSRLKDKQVKRLFRDTAEKIHSSVLIPLDYHGVFGMIALGSEDEHRFHPGMDTLYLKRLGELVAASLSKYVNRA